MNEQDMHEFFRRQELLRAQNKSPDDIPEERVEVLFDHFLQARLGRSFGFFNDDACMGMGRLEWSKVVWIPKDRITSGQVSVKRLPDEVGYLVNMPDWLASKKGLI